MHIKGAHLDDAIRISLEGISCITRPSEPQKDNNDTYKNGNRFIIIERPDDTDKIPTEIYPNIYETFLYLFSQAGVKNISIKKEVNFEKLYNERNKT